jgi:hypothetical protein
MHISNINLIYCCNITFLNLEKWRLGSIICWPYLILFAFFVLRINILLAYLKYTKLGASPSFLGGNGTLN